MCLQRKPTAVFPPGWFQPPAEPVAIDVSGVAPSPPVQAVQRRRRRLWELSASAACPVLGVCLAMSDQRRLMEQCAMDVQGRTDYELHQIAVSECRRRTPFAERVERKLDQAFAFEMRQAKACGDTDILREWWKAARQKPAWAGAMWAVMTHPVCALPLEHEVLGDVHMMQHQVGMVTRVEQQRWEALGKKNAQLLQDIQQWQVRFGNQQRLWKQREEAMQEEISQLRQQLAQQEGARHQMAQRLAAMSETLSGLDTLETLRQERQQLKVENQALTRAMRTAARRVPDAEASPACLMPACEPVAENRCDSIRLKGKMAHVEVPHLVPRRVACVGGRTAQLPAYREVVEAHGLELLHHDGGEEDSLGQLPATLAAADLVICQVGCISHNAYWRVKEHCKRNGKPCVFLESSSRSALERTMTRIIGEWPKTPT